MTPSAFKEAARIACGTKIEDGKSKYKNVEEDNLPYLCMDLVYQYTLLVDGFGKWMFSSNLINNLGVKTRPHRFALVAL